MTIKKIRLLKKVALVAVALGFSSMAAFTVAGIAMVSNANDKMEQIDKTENVQEYEAAKKQEDMGYALSYAGIWASGLVAGAGAVGFHLLSGEEKYENCKEIKRLAEDICRETKKISDEVSKEIRNLSDNMNTVNL